MGTRWVPFVHSGTREVEHSWVRTRVLHTRSQKWMNESVLKAAFCQGLNSEMLKKLECVMTRYLLIPQLSCPSALISWSETDRPTRKLSATRPLSKLMNPCCLDEPSSAPLKAKNARERDYASPVVPPITSWPSVPITPRKLLLGHPHPQILPQWVFFSFHLINHSP